MFTFIHGADFHLDSTFAALTPGQAATRRRESRELPGRLAEYVRGNGIDLVLLAGDLFDTAGSYRETGEALAKALGQMQVPAFIAPGNHDWYGPSSPYATVKWPENVRIFRSAAIESAEVPALNAVVYGGAFTAPEQAESLLAGFSAPADGRVHLMVLHGDLNDSVGRYNPITKEEISASGLEYLALGHVHRRGAEQIGKTTAAWPGCPEGRGFDELGEKGFYQGTVADDGTVTLRFVPFSRHRYESIEADITGQDPRIALEALLPEDTAQDLYRVTFTGETGEQGLDLNALREALESRFYSLELRDRTRMAQDVWARAGEDSLRGQFLRNLRRKLDAAQSEEERETVNRAARFGLAALDHRDLG